MQMQLSAQEDQISDMASRIEAVTDELNKVKTCYFFYQNHG